MEGSEGGDAYFISFLEESMCMNAQGLMQLHKIKNKFLHETAKATRHGDVRKC